MTTVQECKLALKDLKKRLKKDPDAILKILKDAGILTPTGRLTKPYKESYERRRKSSTRS